MHGTGSVAADRVLRELGRRRTATLSDLVAATGLGMGDVQSALGLLDIEGAAVERGCGWVRA